MNNPTSSQISRNVLLFVINLCNYSMKMKKIFLVAGATLPLFLTNCAPKLGGSDYAMADVGANSLSLRGTIVAIRTVNINASQPNQPGVGAAVGAVSGAVIGNVVSNHGPFTTLAGGLLGGVGGHYAEQALTSQEGFEYTVELENGQVQTIAQGAEPRMSVGQRVIVVLNNKGVNGQGARSRVIPDNSSR
jgi:outer membrane lipoprotein SlyB